MSDGETLHGNRVQTNIGHRMRDRMALYQLDKQRVFGVPDPSAVADFMACIQEEKEIRKMDNKEILEGMIDEHGINAVLEMLSDICTEKSLQFKDVWQEARASKRWEKAGLMVEDVRREISQKYGL